MIFTRGVSLTNFVITTSALGFQVFVLCPWHKPLDDEFNTLTEEHLAILHEAEEVQVCELKGINEQLKSLSNKKLWIESARTQPRAEIASLYLALQHFSKIDV
jgi:hypothetical protein